MTAVSLVYRDRWLVSWDSGALTEKHEHAGNKPAPKVMSYLSMHRLPT